MSVADTYNAHGENYHKTRLKGRLFNEFLEVPATLNLLPEQLGGRIVLDAGCGSGFYSNLLVEKGAQVIGVDVSPKMIELAQKETPNHLPITYHVGDLCHLDLEEAAVDLIISNYVLENIEDLKLAFSEFFRVLKPGGECLFSISHPIRAHSSREGEPEVWTLVNYFEGGIRISDFGDGLKVKKYKRTVSEYLNTALEAGFQLKRMVEAQPIEAGKERDPKNYATAMKYPQLMTLLLMKS